MPLLTENTVRGWARSRLSKSWRTDSVILKEAREQTGTFDVFLSHAYLDKELIAGLYSQLKEYGLTVYVDWIEDRELDRTHVTAENAYRIRERIKQSSSMIFAFSQNTNDSVWIPWELGYGDGCNKKVGVLPIIKGVNVATQSPHQEYLGLYPTVDSIEAGSAFWVNFSGGRYLTLKDWLKS